jgi:hypothetical protein
MDVVLAIHSFVRWLILLAAVAVVARLLYGWRRGSEFTGLDRGLLLGYSGLLDVQALLGLVLLFGDAALLGEGFPAARIAHAIVMIVAVAAGHLPSLWRRAPAPVRYRRSLAAIATSLALIVIGIIIITTGQAA